MEPYYEADGIVIYHGDLREVEEWTTADVLVADPPYGMSYKSLGSGATVVGDEDVSVRNAMLSMWGPGPALVFGTWKVLPPHGERQRLVWHKKGGGIGPGDLSLPWGNQHEEVYVLGAGWENSVTGLPRTGSVLETSIRMGSPHGLVARTGHPTAKPVSLMEALIARCPAGRIADPCMGSGSTLIAARNLGRRAVGVEVEERYCEVAAKRLDQVVLFVS